MTDIKCDKCKGDTFKLTKRTYDYLATCTKCGRVISFAFHLTF